MKSCLRSGENFFLDDSVWIIEDENNTDEEEERFRIKEKVVKKAIPLAEPLKKFLEADLLRDDVYYIGDHPTEGASDLHRDGDLPGISSANG